MTNVFKLVKKHEWMQPHGHSHLNLELVDNSYEVYERVFTNLAAKNSCRWQDIHKADVSTINLYVEKIVGFLIVEKYLKECFTFSDADLSESFGDNLKNILNSYNSFL